VRAEELPYTVGTGFEFTSGKYGTTTRTDTVYVPLSIIVSPTPRVSLSLDVPYIFQSNSTIIPGIGGGGNNATGSTATTASETHRSASGIGDVTLRGGYKFFSEKRSWPQVKPTVFIKFPTADKNKSLGTGEFDGGGAIEIATWLGNWYTFAEAGYTIQGRSTLFALRNYMTFNAGAGYQVSHDFFPTLLVNGSTPLANGTGSALEVRARLQYQATDHAGFIGYVSKGISAYSPDYGTGLVVYYSF
jgi:hypothetical protein